MLLRSGDAEAAMEHLKAALGCVQANTELAQAHLLLGFANDLLGRRGEATECYGETLKVAEAAGDDILLSVNVFVVADAKKYSQVPFTSENAKKIEISFDNTAIHDL
jgi:tetratricopeptide (TPR) repeat protein